MSAMAGASGVTGHTRVYALLGQPVVHSRSPALYNALFRRHGLDAVYVALDVPPERPGAVIAAVRALGLAGANLTAPMKERVLPFLDRVEGDGATAGAVNVIAVSEGRLVGHNTDGEGLVRALASEGRQVRGVQAVVLGAGGTGRGVSAALLRHGVAGLRLLNRTEARAEDAASRLAAAWPGAELRVGPLSPRAFAALAEGADLVINCTAGAAAEAIGALDPGALARGGAWVDVNYWMDHPPQADSARRLGLTFHTGHAMLLHQGLLAFALFTGIESSVSELDALTGAAP